MEVVVCLSSTEGDDSHQGRHQQSLFVCAVVQTRIIGKTVRVSVK